VLVKAQLCFFVLNELGTMVKSNFCCKKHPEMDSKICLFSRFTTVSAHFHWSILVHAENTFFFSEDVFQCFDDFDGLLLQVGIEVDAPPLPRFGMTSCWEM
jgi:hypothetical protein